MNMKNRLFFFKMLLFVALMATWTSCSKSDDSEANSPKPVNPTPTNPTDKTDPKDDPYMVVCEHVEKVAKSVDTYYDQCHSMEELKQHLDDIKKIEFVEDVYTTNTTMFVKIKDYGKIAYSFFPKSDDNIADISINRSSIKHSSPKHIPQNIKDNPFLGNKKIAFVVQQQNDERRAKMTSVFKETRQLFEDCGYDVSPKLIAPNVEYFQDGIFTSDIVFLSTHGGYDPESGIHFFLTSEQPDDATILSADDLYNYKDIPDSLVFWNKHTELRNGKEQALWYAVITETWIKNADNSFKNWNKAIIYNTACHSVQGPNPSTKDSINYSVAKIFAGKGAGAYLGYDQSNFIGRYAGVLFLRNLLSGKTVNESFEDLPFDCKHQLDEEYWTDLVLYINPLNPNIANSRINSPFIEFTPEDKSIEDELRWTLSQWIYYFIPNDYCKIVIKNDGTKVVDFRTELVNPYSSPALYGFYISETGNIKDAQMVNVETIGSDNCFFSNKYKLYLEYTLTYKPLALGCMIAPETTYYYWVYFFDGKNYHLSERHSFTTGALKGSGGSDTNTSGQGNLPNVPGSDF